MANSTTIDDATGPSFSAKNKKSISTTLGVALSSSSSIEGKEVEATAKAKSNIDEVEKSHESNGTVLHATVQQPAHQWANLFAKNRSMENDMTLSYIAPQLVNGKVVIQLEKEEVDRETEKWKGALIAYVIGDCPGYNAMRMIASAIGIPMYADECTAKQMCVSFARILVEVNVTKPLPDEIEVMDPSGRVQRRNEEQPAKQGGSKKTVQTWVTKEQTTEQQISNSTGTEQGKRKEARNTDTIDKHTKVAEIQATVVLQNGFDVLNRGYGGSQSAPPDKGGGARITETKVKEHKVATVAAVVAPKWRFHNNYLSAPNGRIWLLWDISLYTVDKLREDAQLLHCQVTIVASDKPCVITVIYGYNTCEQRKNMWETLKVLAQRINMPWLIIGDFNAMLYPQDRLYGNPVQYGEIKDFNDCIHDLLLNEVRWTGEYYTWTNKQQTNDRICSRLDRAFGNHY
ncbi:PREDICTED: uncharacterized protein LOC109217852 [Nicotiana attenuata]|uniref:uncharacterized protein LOC109217852 n=1 Tax=Nicotiana attenuata TaxID=49451 RepID=UPI0009052678|nr:PREDICTED: uncharacterized protein LOC109217852 [Nicotiana attenuata]